MTSAQRQRCARLVDSSQRNTHGLLPTVEDVTVLWREVQRLELALDAASKAASDVAFTQLVSPRQPS